ncbi:hypothetical protein D8S82_05970 [Mycobacterium hodleri]|uniref:Mercury transporter n=1 Tax=Mycolicibacterium hodleri TaxID=49897 RepID=A0A544W685_9MYCO|nr:hypothetical protein [Mycolicibacterium hodleri]TQR87729.1 hypothetical protein D8S82_05970 [Mycolicibacterium hodleri]
MATRRTSPSVIGVLGVVGTAALLMICCAGPALIAGGALAVLGELLHSTWLIGAAVVMVLGTAGYLLHRHGRPTPPSAAARPGTESAPLTRRHLPKGAAPESNSPPNNPPTGMDT